MLNTYQLGRNIFFRIFSGIIILGFVFLLFLPASFNFRDLFDFKSGYVILNGEEIFFKKFPISNTSNKNAFNKRSLSDMLCFESSQSVNEETKTYYRSIIRSVFEDGSIRKNILINPIKYTLAKDLNLTMDEENLSDFIEKAYEQYLLEEYKYIQTEAKKGNKVDPKIKFYAQMSLDDFIRERYAYTWKNFISKAPEELETQYLISIINSGIDSLHTPIPKQYIVAELESEKQKSQVEFILYRKKDYLHELAFSKDFPVKELEEFYKNNYPSTIIVKKMTFKTKEKGTHLLSKEKIFENPLLEKIAIKKNVNPKLYAILDAYKVNETTSVIKNEFGSEEEQKKEPYIAYQVISKTDLFKDIFLSSQELQSKTFSNERKEKYKKILFDFITQEKDFLKNFDERAQSLFKEIKEKVNNTKSLASLYDIYKERKSLDFFFYGKTDLFSLKSQKIDLIEFKDPTNQVAEKKMSLNRFFFIQEENSDRFKNMNINFFTKAFSLKNQETSSLTKDYYDYLKDEFIKQKETFDLKQEKIGQIAPFYYIIRKVNEESIDYANILGTNQAIILKQYLDLKANEISAFENVLIRYLEKQNKIQLDVNLENIYKYCGF